MITRISIANFQSLARATVEPGQFTVIVGESDLGKSAILRAVQALVANASGHDFIRQGAEKAAVELRFDDGSVVQWLKGASSQYNLYRPGASKRAFSHAGRAAPELIAELLRLAPADAGGERTNPTYHGQFESPYLVALSPLARAKVLGELSGANTLYLAAQEARRRQLANQKVLQVRQEDRETVQSEVAAMSYLPAQKQALTGILAQARAIDEAYRRVAAIRQLATRLRDEERVSVYHATEHARREQIAQQLATVDFDALERASAIRACVSDLADAQHQANVRQIGVGIIEREAATIDAELASVPLCPTCGQPLLTTSAETEAVET